MHSSEDEGCEHMHDVTYRHNMLKKTAILFIVKFIFKTGLVIGLLQNADV